MRNMSFHFIVLVAAMAIKKRASSVPVGNQAHKKQKIGYAGEGADKAFVGITELNRAGQQIGYPDLAKMTTFDCKALLKNDGAERKLKLKRPAASQRWQRNVPAKNLHLKQS